MASVQELLHKVKQADINSPLEYSTDISQAMRDALSPSGPSPAITIGNNIHWRVMLINARRKHVDFVDPFGTGFLRSVKTSVQEVYQRDLIQTELNKLPEQHRSSFPLPPRQNDRQCWQEYEEVCPKAGKTAAKRKDKITKELKWQSGVAARQRIQKQYSTKQKQMNKQFFGEATDRKQLTCTQ